MSGARPAGGPTRAAALLVAGGRGERLGRPEPKAFVEVAGRPLLAHAGRLPEVAPEVEAWVVVVPPGREAEARAILSGCRKLLEVVAGGVTRQASVWNALRTLPEEYPAVVCHDVARPFAGPDLLSAALRGIREADGAIPVVPIPDTVKQVAGDRVERTLDRDRLLLAQTPQAFRRAALEEAHRRARAEGIEGTDDAELLERAGFVVATFPGRPSNLKITRPGDLERAEAMWRAGLVGESSPAGSEPGDGRG